MSCSHSLGADDRFYPRCGTDQESEAAAAAAPGPIAESDAPVAAQLRLVSVLFADLVGFTPYSEQRDPEEVRDLLTDYFDRSRAIIEQFGGTVDKFIGDAVMAVWGGGLPSGEQISQAAG